MGSLISDFITPLPLVGLFLIVMVIFYFLSKGADIIVNEAVAVSTHLRIPTSVIGATIVSLGTTLPEVSVSVLAAMKGNYDLALGNAIGSVMVDTGFILGLTLLISPIIFDYSAIRIESWIQFFTGLFIVVIAMPVASEASIGVISKTTGMMMTVLLIVYLVWSFRNGMNKLEYYYDDYTEKYRTESLIKQVFFLILGMGIVIISSDLLITVVETIGLKLGVSQTFLATTLVAFGTSIPELVTSIKAILKGHGDLAFGNIIGADILNVLFVTGLAAVFAKNQLLVSEVFFNLHFPAMLFILVAFRYFTLVNKHTIGRMEGGILLGTYLVYLGLTGM